MRKKRLNNLQNIGRYSFNNAIDIFQSLFTPFDDFIILIFKTPLVFKLGALNGITMDRLISCRFNKFRILLSGFPSMIKVLFPETPRPKPHRGVVFYYLDIDRSIPWLHKPTIPLFAN